MCRLRMARFSCLTSLNNSSDTLRDVVLEIRYSWLWTDEFPRQGNTAGGSARFEYKPSPPLPVRRDGSFLVDVKIAGFERVYR